VEGNTAAWFIDNGDGLVVKDTPLDLNRFNSYRPSYREKYSYEDYYENLYLLQFYQFEEQMRGEVSPRAMVKDIYTNMVRALEELREDMTDDEVEYLLGSYYAVGYLLKILPTMEKAEVIFKKLLQKDSYSIHANLALAELYYLEGVSEELQPSGDGWSYICVWKQSDLMEIALQHFLAAYQLEKQQDHEVLAPISHYRIFVLHCFQGEFAKAIEHLEGLTPADPAQYLNCLELGRQLEKTNENPRVIEILL
jgi:tetratricopeptide (TPR) repeat protein